MMNVVFCTFTRGHGRRPGLIKHGFIDVKSFKKVTSIPDSCVYVDINQRELRMYHNNETSEEVTLDHWGLSGNLFEMCRDMKDLDFPFMCHCVVNSIFGEYE